MSHHAGNDSEFPPEAKRIFDDMVKKMSAEVGAGATGLFPRGQLHRTDEGEIRIAVTVEKNTVILAFGKPTAWIGMSRVEACELADLIKLRASEL